MIFLGDMTAFQDSLADPLTTKRIDYLIDSSGQKKLRILQNHPAASTFLLDGGEPARLRSEQDTIYILIETPLAGHPSKRAGEGMRYDRLGFFLNRFGELETFVTGGLNHKMQLIRSSQHTSGSFNSKDGHTYLVADPSITSYGHNRDRLELNGCVNAQNYKNYFAPSISLGAAANIYHRAIRNVYGIYWEPMFLFAPDAQGRLQTYRNDFLVIRYGFEHLDETADENPAGNNLGFGFGTNFSLGYLIGGQGGLITPHTFRLTLGSLKALKGGFHLEPCLYFNDFFKGVTPGIRLSLGGF